MKGAIMQPYFFPYIGYFQLISAVDEFIVYDNIKFTKKGWINRNRILVNGSDVLISLPLKKDSDFLDVVQRELSAEFDRSKLINQIKGAYAKASKFSEAFPLIEKIIRHEESNLFLYILNSIEEVCRYLLIKTEIKISSAIGIDHTLKSQEKVIALCKKRGVNSYINAIGGMELYSKDDFLGEGIELKFIQSNIQPYPQGNHEFVSHLSIIDMLMHCDKQAIRNQLSNYSLV